MRILLALVLPFLLVGTSAHAAPVLAASFVQEQLGHERPKVARDETLENTKKWFEQLEIPFPPSAMLLRAFKEEEQLELWVQPKKGDAYRRIKVYDFCSNSGVLGPKRHQGDLQIPEGYYRINHFNPYSYFYLSLGINYPNKSDRILKTKGRSAGGSIYIHGDCVTIGCIPITDPMIKELYWIAVETHSAGQARIPVHIFPFHLTDDNLKNAEETYDEALLSFWKNLRGGYDYFQKHNELPIIWIDDKGAYHYESAQ